MIAMNACAARANPPLIEQSFHPLITVRTPPRGLLDGSGQFGPSLRAIDLNLFSLKNGRLRKAIANQAAARWRLISFKTTRPIGATIPFGTPPSWAAPSLWRFRMRSPLLLGHTQGPFTPCDVA